MSKRINKRNVNKALDKMKSGDNTMFRVIPKSVSRLSNRLFRTATKMPIISQGKRPRIGNKPLFKLGELCEFFEIAIPVQYSEQKNLYVSETSLFKRVENRNKLILEMEIRKELPSKYYNQFRLTAQKFKHRFQGDPNIKQDDVELLLNFLRWWHNFSSIRFSANNYFDYKLYKRTLGESDAFASRGYLLHVSEVCSIPEYRKYFMNKGLFNKTFKEFVHRDSIYVTETSFERFLEFTEKHPRFFAKPTLGMKGRGAQIIQINNNEKEVYEILKEDQFMAEELVQQHPEIAKFNPDALNTLRVVTLLTADNTPIITYAGIRFGREGSVVDNVSTGGMTTSINIKTGEISTDGINMYGQRILKHPDTGLVFKGFQIPHWEEIITTVKAASKVVPQVRNIGWDVAVTNDGQIELIEGNSQPAFRIMQIAEDVGKKHLYEKHIDELEKKNWKKRFQGGSDGSVEIINKRNQDFAYAIVSDMVILEKYIGKKAHVVIPSKIDGLPVREIEEQAFSKDKNIESVIINDSVNKIGPFAFTQCKNLKNIEFPKELTVLSRGIFKKCNSIETIKLPNGIKTIPREMFKSCSKLRTVEVPDRLEKVQPSAFENCVSLKSVFHICSINNQRLEGLPTTVNYIGSRVFKNCIKLEKFKIPTRIRTIHESLFEGCEELNQIELHEKIKNIKNRAFADCPNLTEITLPKNLENFAENAVTESRTVLR